MATTTALQPSRDFREALLERGGGSAAKCYQCATCSSVCGLSSAEAPFPRRQMLWAQWGLADRIAADPALWLCHQCSDCSERCPRGARPGDVLQAARSLAVEALAWPALLGRIVARARVTWPLLVGLPLLFWAALLAAAGQLRVPPHFHAFEEIVPHTMIYAVFFPLAGFAAIASAVGGRRLWRALGESGSRPDPLFSRAIAVAIEIASHRRFGECGSAGSRRSGHLALVAGFVGAALTSGLLIIAIYLQGASLPLALGHPYKVLGNVSALLLALGIGVLAVQRFRQDQRVVVSTAFDWFLDALIVLVVLSGICAELLRLLAVNASAPPAAAVVAYVVHLGAVTTLFLSFPYSKFAHAVYRTLALIHERPSQPRSVAGDAR